MQSQATRVQRVIIVQHSMSLGEARVQEIPSTDSDQHLVETLFMPEEAAFARPGVRNPG
jgi:hypothetical protein